MSEVADYRALSSRLERETGYDSIDTIETHYIDQDRPTLFLCCFPRCHRRTRTAQRMWLHVHFSKDHGLSFGVGRPEDLTERANR